MANIEDQILRDKFQDLYQQLNYHGSRDVEDSARLLFSSAPLPYCNHWRHRDEFLTSYYLFKALAHKLEEKDFVDIFVERKELPEFSRLNNDWIEITGDHQKMVDQGIFLFDFLISLWDVFEMETQMLEQGVIFGYAA